MNSLKSILPLLIGLCCLPHLSHAQTITQDEFLDQLKQLHPLFEKEKMTAQIEKEERSSFLGAQDWNLLSSISFAHEEPASALAGPERIDALTVSGGVERVFWRTGSRLSASFTSSRASLKIDPLWGFPDSFYENRLAVTCAHPLLKNKNGFLDRLKYNLKQFDVDFLDVQAFEKMEDFLASSADKFLDWVLLTEQKKIASDRLSLAEEELVRAEKKEKLT